MRGIKEDAIAKISWGILGVIGMGLISGTAYVVTLANAQESLKKQLDDVKVKVSSVDDIKTDIAVIRSKVEQIQIQLEGHTR